MKANHVQIYDSIAEFMGLEAGIVVPPLGYTNNFTAFFTRHPIEEILNSITLIWQFFNQDTYCNGFPSKSRT